MPAQLDPELGHVPCPTTPPRSVVARHAAAHQATDNQAAAKPPGPGDPQQQKQQKKQQKIDPPKPLLYTFAHAGGAGEQQKQDGGDPEQGSCADLEADVIVDLQKLRQQRRRQQLLAKELRRRQEEEEDKKRKEIMKEEKKKLLEEERKRPQEEEQQQMQVELPEKLPTGQSELESVPAPTDVTYPVHRSGRDNPNNVNYLVYDYMSVQRFTPLSNTNWYAADAVTSVTITGWTATLCVVFNRLTGHGPAISLDVEVQVTSYERNSFRVRFSPDGPLEEFTRGPIVGAQLSWLRRDEEVRLGREESAPRFVTDDPHNALVFETADLRVYVNTNSAVVVTRKRDGEVVYQDDEIWGKSRGLMFVRRGCGPAIASVRRNRKDDPTVREAFYGAGQIVAENDRGDFYLDRTGLAMANYNYDNLNYDQPGVVPPEISEESPNYYVPMQYAAPWLVVQGYRGMARQYSYGWFLDNAGQTYMNTGDTKFNGESDKAYMGAVCGPFDQHFVYGAGDGIEPVVTAFAQLQGRDFEGQLLNRCAAMPPKYIFGFFQGMYGARGLLPEHVECTKENNFSTWKEVVDGYQSHNVPFEGLAVDIDVQDDLQVFTTRDSFWTAGKVGKPGDRDNQCVFDWAHDKGLVTQTNITCFIRADRPGYSVYDSLVRSGVYTRNDAADAADPKWGDAGPPPFATNTVGPADAYCGKLNFGGGDECRAIFPDWGRVDVPRWWGAHYATLFALGLDFVWQDMTVPAMAGHVRGRDLDEEPDYEYLDNVPHDGEFNWKSYHPQTFVTDMRKSNGDREPFLSQRNMHAYRLCEATREGGLIGQKEALKKFKRSYIIARGGCIGNQHFGGVWAGDNSSTQDYLQMMVTTALSMNMSCLSVVGSDIGGFMEWSGRAPCPERLMTRWVQAGCLLPWFRDHYDRWVADKPHGKDYQELYRYSEPALAAMRSAIELRYRWQDVLYTAMFQNAFHGTPLLKAMSMWDGDADVAPYQKDQFLLGGHDGYQILCAPVVHVDSDVRDVHLPAGATWLQYGVGCDEKPLGPAFHGGQTVRDFWVAPDELALFVQEGAVLPVRYPAQRSRNKGLSAYTHADPLVLEVFGLTPEAAGLLYVDDGGVTTSAEDRGVFSVVEIGVCFDDADKDGNAKSAALTFSAPAELPRQNKYVVSAPVYLRLRNAGAVVGAELFVHETEVSTTTSALEAVRAEDKYGFFEASGDCLYWVDEESKSVWLKVPGDIITTAAEVKLACEDSVYVK